MTAHNAPELADARASDIHVLRLHPVDRGETPTTARQLAPSPIVLTPGLSADGAVLTVDLDLALPGLGRDRRRFTLTPQRLWTQTQHYVDSLTGFDVTLSAEPSTRRIEVSVVARVQSRRQAIYRGDFAYANHSPPTAFRHWDEIDPGMLAEMRRRLRRPGARQPAAARWMEEDVSGAESACAALGAPRFVACAAAALHRLRADAPMAAIMNGCAATAQAAMPQTDEEPALIYAFGADCGAGCSDDAARDTLGGGVWIASDGRAGWFGPVGATARACVGFASRRSACLAAGQDFAAARAAFETIDGGPQIGWRWNDGLGAAVAVTGPAGYAGDQPEFAATALAWLRGRCAVRA